MNPITLITGANGGIGYYIAKGIADAGHHVIMVCRNPVKAKAAQERLMQETGNTQIDLLICDLSSQQQIRDTAAKINADYPRLDILINNAGLMNSACVLSEDNIEMAWAVNNLAPFLLTHLLLDKLRASTPARIINLSSSAHWVANINFNNLYHEKNYGTLTVYAQSKLASLLWTFEMARRLEGSGITVNAVHPGTVATGIGDKGVTKTFRFLWNLIKPVILTEKKGARTPIYLALSEKVADKTGKYYVRKRPRPTSKRSRNRDLALKVWELNEKMTGLDQDTPA